MASRLLFSADIFFAAVSSLALVLLVYSKGVASQTVAVSPPPPPPPNTFTEAIARVLEVLHEKVGE